MLPMKTQNVYLNVFRIRFSSKFHPLDKMSEAFNNLFNL